jgi:hypothetical protein
VHESTIVFDPSHELNAGHRLIRQRSGCPSSSVQLSRTEAQPNFIRCVLNILGSRQPCSD